MTYYACVKRVIYIKTVCVQNGAIVKFGRLNNLRFLDPCYDERPPRPRNNSLQRNVQDYYDRYENVNSNMKLFAPRNILGNDQSAVCIPPYGFVVTA